MGTGDWGLGTGDWGLEDDRHARVCTGGAAGCPGVLHPALRVHPAGPARESAPWVRPAPGCPPGGAAVVYAGVWPRRYHRSPASATMPTYVSNVATHETRRPVRFDSGA